MSNAEIIQCVLDIKSWFSRTKGAALIKSAATTVDIQRLEKTIDTSLPESLSSLLLEVNGGIYFLDKPLLGTADIADIYGQVERSKQWKSGLVPFCGDETSLLVVDSQSDEVYEWDSSDGLGDLIARNLLSYLEDYRNNLLSGHFEYFEDVGVIEKMTSKPGK